MAYPHQPELRARVHFLEQQHGVRIRWQHGASPHSRGRAFAPAVDIIVPDSWSAEPITIPIAGTDHSVRKAFYCVSTGEKFGITVGDRIQHLVAVDGRTVYVLIDIEGFALHPGGSALAELFDLTFNRAIGMAAEYVRTYDWSAEAAAFVAWRGESTERQLRTWRGNIRDNDHELDTLVRRIANLVRVNGELRSNIAAMETLTKTERQAAASADFEAITRMVPDLVESVSIDYGRLRVALAPVTIEHDGYSFEMGRYTLTIDGDAVSIAGDRGFDYPHPHVSSDGTPCWGNLAPAIGRLLGEGEYAALVTAVREFLQSYNARDAYQGIERWDPDYEDSDDEGEPAF